jgi:hypothetical protein
MARRHLLTAALFLTVGGDPRPLQSGSGGADAGPLPGFPTTDTTPTQCAAANVGGVQLDTLTYSNFGQAFFTSWCTRCHATTVTGGVARHGAPSDHNFDTLAGVQQWAIQIDQVAAMNPTGSPRNDFMPAEPPFPPDDERKKLACFIATGLQP